MKRNSIVILFLMMILQLPAGKLSAGEFDYVQPFKLDPINETIQITAGVGLTGSAIVFDKCFKIKANQYYPEAWPKSDIPNMDQFFMRPYSKPLHITGTATMALAVASPLFFVAMPPKEWPTIGTMYGETMLLANGIKEWLKLIVYRARPYMYFDNYPLDKVEKGDWSCSFPSGHTTLAFASAAFTTMVYCQCYPESVMQYVVAGVSFGLATITGALRVASGNHFLSDVLIGAIIGTACGFLVPFLHSQSFYNSFQKPSDKTSADISPAGLTFTFAL